MASPCRNANWKGMRDLHDHRCRSRYCHDRRDLLLRRWNLFRIAACRSQQCFYWRDLNRRQHFYWKPRCHLGRICIFSRLFCWSQHRRRCNCHTSGNRLVWASCDATSKARCRECGSHIDPRSKFYSIRRSFLLGIPAIHSANFSNWSWLVLVGCNQ